MFTFDAEKHTYTVNGIPLPSVTEVIGEWLRLKDTAYFINVFSGSLVHADKFLTARECGSATHKACAYIAAGEGVDMQAINPALIPPIKQFEKWMQDFNVKPLIVEQPMLSKINLFAGTPDILCHIQKDKKTVALIDVKTGLINNMVGAQTAAYEMLAREYAKVKQPITRYELVLPRDGSAYKFKILTGKDDSIFFFARLNQFNYIKRQKQ